MAVIYDARGNEYHGALDSINGLTINDTRTATGVLAAASATASADIQGKATLRVSVNCTSALTGTLVIEGTVDGTNYFTIPFLVESSVTALIIVGKPRADTGTALSAGLHLFTCNVSAYRSVRVRMSSYTSGSVTVALRASLADEQVFARPVPASESVSVQGTANTATTLTLTTPPTGLVTYLVALRLIRASAASVAGIATLAITTTNMQSLGWLVGNGMGAGSTQIDVDWQLGTPLRCPGGACSVSMPAAGLAVLWSANAVYYFDA
jgi:hypothetical protein